MFTRLKTFTVNTYHGCSFALTYVVAALTPPPISIRTLCFYLLLYLQSRCSILVDLMERRKGREGGREDNKVCKAPENRQLLSLLQSRCSGNIHSSIHPAITHSSIHLPIDPATQPSIAYPPIRLYIIQVVSVYGASSLSSIH